MPSSATDALVGTVLDGRYRIESHIADGGMASVYVALDERLDREVALKIMKPSLASDPAFVERFQREARSAARLSHPGVVAVFDQGSDGHLVFLVMELVRGQTLREVMAAEGPLTPRAALDFLEQALQALGAAHAAGLIHRDVKPENVILREDGAVKVADFGLMRAAVTGTGTATAQTGVLLGTVAYLSPEQVEKGVADARSDVYAAGLLLFEMLTGTKAFVGETAIQVAYQHVYSQVPAPSSRVASIPPELDQLVALATARDPADRPADARALLREVRRARAGLSAEQLDRRPQAAGGVAAPTPTVAVPHGGAGDSDAPDGASSRTEVLGMPAAGMAAAGTAAGMGAPGAAAGATQVVPVPDSTQVVAAAATTDVVPAAATTDIVPAAGTTQVVPLPGPAAAAPTATLPASGRAGSASRAGAAPTAGSPGGVTAGSAVGQMDQLLGGPDQHREAAPRRRRRAWPVVLLLVLAAAVAAALWFYRAGPGATTNVPVVAGQSQAVATARLSAAHLAVTTRRAYSESVRSGVVISSDPRAGASVARDTTIALTVSRGPERHDVPSLKGRSQAEAEAAITAARLRVGSVDSTYDEKVPQGQVISSDPSAGTALRRGASVDLVVSKGRRPITVADWTGKPVADAVAALGKQGLKVSSDQQQFSTTVVKDSVISQTPAGGSTAFKGDTVTLVVSKGPESSPVPDVTFKTVTDARRILTDAGFKVQVNDVIGGGVVGRVTSQFPSAGTQAPAGSVVTLTAL